MRGALRGICVGCMNQGRCGIVCMNEEGIQLIPLVKVAECSQFHRGENLEIVRLGKKVAVVPANMVGRE